MQGVSTVLLKIKLLLFVLMRILKPTRGFQAFSQRVRVTNGSRACRRPRFVSVTRFSAFCLSPHPALGIPHGLCNHCLALLHGGRLAPGPGPSVFLLSSPSAPAHPSKHGSHGAPK